MKVTKMTLNSKILVAVVLSSVIFFLLLRTYSFFDPVTDIEPVDCKTETGFDWCIRKYQDDGFVQWSSQTVNASNCCRISRKFLNSKKMDFSQKFCSEKPTDVVSCSRWEKSIDYGEVYKIDGKILKLTSKKGREND